MAVIGICGSYGGLNVGDEAILTSILERLGAADRHHEFVVFSRDAAHTQKHQPVDRTVATRDASRDEVAPEIERLDLFILGGGGLLYDEEVRWYLRDVRLAQERAVPTFGYALGAGPLRDAEDRRLVRETLDRMTAITVRDEVSKRVLEEVGVEAEITVTADPALLLSPEPFTTEMRAQEGIARHRWLVGMSVREPGKAAPDLDEAGYHALLAHAADFVVHRFDADVVFIPMERDDIRHSHAVISNMRAAARAHVVTGDYSPRQILGLMDHLELVIGMRLHFLIFAAISAVPFLPLPYASKVSSFVDAVGVPAPASVHRESAGPLLAAIDQLWDGRADERARLPDQVARMREKSRRTVELVCDLLE